MPLVLCASFSSPWFPPCSAHMQHSSLLQLLKSVCRAIFPASLQFPLTCHSQSILLIFVSPQILLLALHFPPPSGVWQWQTHRLTLSWKFNAATLDYYRLFPSWFLCHLYIPLIEPFCPLCRSSFLHSCTGCFINLRVHILKKQKKKMAFYNYLLHSSCTLTLKPQMQVLLWCGIHP